MHKPVLVNARSVRNFHSVHHYRLWTLLLSIHVVMQWHVRIIDTRLAINLINSLFCCTTRRKMAIQVLPTGLALFTLLLVLWKTFNPLISRILNVSGSHLCLEESLIWLRITCFGATLSVTHLHNTLYPQPHTGFQMVMAMSTNSSSGPRRT